MEKGIDDDHDEKSQALANIFALAKIAIS